MMVYMNEAAESQQPPEEVQADVQPQVDVTVDTNSAELQSDAAVAEQQAVTPEQEAELKQVEISKMFDMAGAEYPADSDTSVKAERTRQLFQRFSEKPLDQLQKMSRLHETRRAQAAEGVAAFLHPDVAEQATDQADQTAESKILRPNFGNFNTEEDAEDDTEDYPLGIKLPYDPEADLDPIDEDVQEEETSGSQETTLAAERQKTTQLLQDTLRLNELQELQDAVMELGENPTQEQIQAVFEQVVTDTVLNRVTYELSSLQKQGEPKQVISEAEQKLAALWVKDRLKNDGNTEGTIAERSMGVISVVTELHDLIDEEETVLQRLVADKGEEGEAILQYFDAKKQILLRPWVEASTQDKYNQVIAQMLKNEAASDDATSQEATENDATDEGEESETELAIPKFEKGQEGYWKQYLVETVTHALGDNDSGALLDAFFGNVRGKIGGREFARSGNYEIPKGYEQKTKAHLVEEVRGDKSSKMAEAVLGAMRDSDGTPGLISAGLANEREIQSLLRAAENDNKPGAMAQALESILEQAMKTATPDKQKTLMEAIMVRIPQELYSKKEVAFDSTVLDYFHQQIENQSDPSKRWTELEWTTSDKIGSQSGGESSSADISQEAAAA